MFATGPQGKFLIRAIVGLALALPAGTVLAENEGQEDLDKATQMQLEVGNDGRKLAEVIDLLNSAIEKGLDEDNENFAKQMLAGALMQRGGSIATALLSAPLPNPAQDPRWTQVRLVALADLTKVVELDPDQHKAYILMARLYQLPQGDAEEAMKMLDKVIDAEKVEPEVKAEAYARRAAGQTDMAKQLEDLDKAVELAGDQDEYRLMRARHHFVKKEFDKSLADVDAVIESHEESAAAHELRGNILAAQEKPDEALEALNKATELAPTAVTPYLHRSQIHANLGNLDQAIDEATKIIELQPQSPLGLLLRSNYYLQNSQGEEALADINRVLRMNPHDPTSLLTKARILASLGREKEALTQLEDTAEAAPQVALYLQVGQFALQLEMPRRAIAALDKAIKLEPKNALLLRFRGDAKLNISEHKGAVADFEEALKLNAEDEGLLNNLAWVLATSPQDEVRNGKRAVELATKACELSEYSKPHILSTLAAAYAETGDFEAARKWSAEAVEKATKALESTDSEEREAKQEELEQLEAELENFKQEKPVREAQHRDSGERDGEPEKESGKPEKENKPAESKPAPGRTIDF
jgi:tetratricopeptide (TPR) repeat protein